MEHAARIFDICAKDAVFLAEGLLNAGRRLAKKRAQFTKWKNAQKKRKKKK